jgi:hypothetical protein
MHAPHNHERFIPTPKDASTWKNSQRIYPKEEHTRLSSAAVLIWKST